MNEINKLVRDKIIDIIKNNNEEPIYHILNDEEYKKELLRKNNEELEEVKNALTKEEVKEELADLYEVLKALAEYNGFRMEDIVKEADMKREKRGGFSKRIYLEKVK